MRLLTYKVSYHPKEFIGFHVVLSFHFRFYYYQYIPELIVGLEDLIINRYFRLAMWKYISKINVICMALTVVTVVHGWSFDLQPIANTRSSGVRPSSWLRSSRNIARDRHSALRLQVKDEVAVDSKLPDALREFHFPASSSTNSKSSSNSAVASATLPSLPSIDISKQWIARIILLTVSAFYGTNFGCVKILGAALHPG